MTGLWLLINMEPQPRRWAKLLRHQFGDSKLHVHHSSAPGSAGIRGTGSSPQALRQQQHSPGGHLDLLFGVGLGGSCVPCRV